MMSRPVQRNRRGLTLLELVLAMTITVMIAGAIASMMAAIATGVETRQDTRGVMIRASAAQSRLGAYVASSRCVLDAGRTDLVLWLNDDREGETVHASEVRWLLYEESEGVVDVLFVSFPDDWSEVECEVADREFASSSDWEGVLYRYQAMDLIASVRLVDGLETLALSTNAAGLDAQVVSYELGFAAEQGRQDVVVTASLRQHEEPIK